MGEEIVEKGISQAVVRSMPRYYRYLGDLLEQGVERVSSNELSKLMKVTASQIRQDLNNFGGFGQQGYGYNVKYLYTEIAKILGLDKKYTVIIVGAGNLGQAIMNYTDFARRGYEMTAIFDISEDLIGKKVGNIEIKDAKELEDYVKNNHVDIAALTVPKKAAVEAANNLVNWGVKAIWNFAPTDLNLPDDVIIENVHLAESIMRLSYKINASNKSKKEEQEE